METGADKNLFTINPSLAECITPLHIDSPADCSDTCSTDLVALVTTNIHNSLDGLQGGQNGQYYHLTQIQYQAVLNANTPSGSNAFATLADINNTTYAFSNGLSTSSNNVYLGGSLIHNTTIGMAGFGFNITDTNVDIETNNTQQSISYENAGLTQTIKIQDVSSFQQNVIDEVTNDSSSIGQGDPRSVLLQVFNGSTSNVKEIDLLNSTGTGVVIHDTIDNIGLIGGTLFPLSGSPNQYLQAGNVLIASANNGLSVTSGTVQLGGTLIHDTVIEQSDKVFTINYAATNSSVEDQFLLGGSNGFTSLSNSAPITTLLGDDYTVSNINNWDGSYLVQGQTFNYNFQAYNFVLGFQTIQEVSDGSKSYFKPFFTLEVTDPIRVSNLYEKPKGLSTVETFAAAMGVTPTYISGKGLFAYDLIDSVGLQYAEDYSPNNAANPRWIPDKNYVDGKVSSSVVHYFADNAITQSGNTFLLGGELSQNTTIDLGTGPSFTLGFLNGDITVNGLTVGKGKSFKSGNTAFGVTALSAITTGNSNTAIGNLALRNTTIGANNVAVGNQALITNIIGNFNTAIGNAALNGSTGNSNTAVGSGALISSTNASSNTTVGAGASQNNTTGSFNTIIGTSAAIAQTTANNNTMIGYGAGGNLSAGANGSSNVFIGYQAGYSETGSNKLYICNSSTSTPLIGGDFSTSQLTINGKLIITDSSLNGAVYNADYSAANASNPRWLIDKGYADGHYSTISSATYTASNGITKTGNNFTLGGTLTTSETIINASQTIQFNNSGHGIFEIVETLSAQADIDFAIGDNLVKGVAGSFAGIYMETHDTDWGLSFIALSRDKLQLCYTSPINQVTGFIIDNSLTGIPGITVKDDYFSVGLFYTGDYSFNNSSNSRWITDKGYTDTHLGGVLLSSTVAGTIPWTKMTTTQRTGISSPTEGLAVYDITLHKLYVYDGTIWQAAW